MEGQGQHSIAGSGAGKGSAAEPEEVMMIEETWMQPYLAYMVNKTLPEDTVEAKRIIRRSKAFVVLQEKLYKKSITGGLQRCVTPQEGQEILRDIHAGVCGHHASSRAIAAKAFRAGFYWLTADEGMPNRPSIFAYLVFGPGGITVEGITRPMKVLAWSGPGT
jgi:hypothetical protein